MTTRSELRAKERTKSSEEPAQSVPAESQSFPKAKHYFRFRIVGTFFLTLLTLMMLINSTILNRDFAKHQIESSSLESLMLDQVNSSLTQYGISTSVLSKNETDKIISQAIDQVYSGEKINLDLSPVLANVNSSVNDQLAQYGLSTSMLPAGGTSSITSNVNSAVNSQLNTPVVAQVTTGIRIAKVVVNLILFASLAMLVILIMKAGWQKHLLASFSWISLLTLLVFNLLVTGIKVVVSQSGAQFPDLSPFITQVVEAVQQRGMTYSLLLGGLAIILFVIRAAKRFWQPRH